MISLIMKRLFTFTLTMTMAVMAYAQTVVTIPQITTPVDLANCNDRSVLDGDTVTIVAYVVTSGNLAEVKSSSTQGANGIRPFVWLNDTANGGAIGPNTGIEVVGVNYQTTQATQGITSLIEGDIIELTGVVDYFNGTIQLAPLGNNSIQVVGEYKDPIEPVIVGVDVFNDENQINNLNTGEPYQGAFVEINDVTVTSVNPFGSGTDARVTFTVSDADGNQIEIYDFFLAQRLPSWNTLNPNSPATNGSFVPPSVGTFYTSLKGVVDHDINGCTGSGSGFRIHPFDSTHYQVGATAPAITNVEVDPNVPTSSDIINVSADIQDFDGTLDTVQLFYSIDPSDLPSEFTPNNMTLVAGVTYEFDIPAQADGSNIRYYIKAVDNDTLISYYPNKPASQQEPNTSLIVVRDNGLSIQEVQTPTGTGDASPFEGQLITVGGYVTASARQCDLGYVYIQDSANTEYAGLPLRGSLNLFNLYRNQYVEVTGTIVENFGFTLMNVESITETSRSYEVPAVVLNPADSMDMEKYESMLVRYENPAGQLYITDADAGFGEYKISTDINNTSESNSKRAMAGRASDGSAESSLYVQLVSDDEYATVDGTMVYTPVVTDTTMTMDAMTGIIYYAFGTYKLTPRTNHDIVGLSEDLDTTCDIQYISLQEGRKVEMENVSIFPNPASDVITIEHNLKNIKAEIYSVSGQLLQTRTAGEGVSVTMEVSSFDRGVYILRVTDGHAVQTKKLLIN